MAGHLQPAGTFSDDEFKATIQAETGFIPHTDQVRGFVYEVESGRLREVKP